MGSITQLNDKLRTVPQQLVSDDQACAAIRELSALDGEVDLLDVAVRKGLLAISVPSDFGGADLPNELIADLVTTVARQSREVARGALSHFVAMELIRSAGTAEQRRGIYNRVLIGERLAHVGFGFPDTVSTADGIGLRLALPAETVPALRQDWTVLPIVDERSRRGIAVIPTSSLNLPDDGSGVHLPGDNVLLFTNDSEAVARAVEVLLEASLKLGELTAATGILPEPEPFGQQAVLVELLIAMIGRISTTIDGLQVGSVAADLSSLERSVFALQDLNRRARVESAAIPPQP
jgi:hypothetical protein